MKKSTKLEIMLEENGINLSVEYLNFSPTKTATTITVRRVVVSNKYRTLVVEVDEDNLRWLVKN